MIYARDTILCRPRKDIEITGLEAVWLEVTIKSKKVLVGGIYRPPNSIFFYLLRNFVNIYTYTKYKIHMRRGLDLG